MRRFIRLDSDPESMAGFFVEFVVQAPLQVDFWGRLISACQRMFHELIADDCMTQRSRSRPDKSCQNKEKRKNFSSAESFESQHTQIYALSSILRNFGNIPQERAMQSISRAI